MISREHADTLERVFREMGLDARVLQTGNELWAVTITRPDGKLVCVNDDAVGLYDTEDAFYDGTESQAIPLS